MIEIVSWLAVLILVFSSVPQIGRVIKHREVRDLSAWGMALLWAGTALLFVRAFTIHDYIFVVQQGATLGFASFMLFLRWKYRNNTWKE